MNKFVVQIFALLLLLGASGEALGAGPLSCKGRLARILEPLTPLSSKKALQNAKARELAEIIAVDSETRELVSNPWIAQYIYVNYFAEDIGQGELRYALQGLVDDWEARYQDIFDLVNNRLAQKLDDPEVLAKVKEAFGDEEVLRPSRTQTKLTDFRVKWQQVKGLFSTLSRMRNIIREGMSQQMMDRALFDFYGAMQLGLENSQLRKWDVIEGGFSAVRPGQVEGISPDAWGQIAQFASETEAPIHGYSNNSGEILRGVMPALSSFMGKNQEEYLAFTQKEALEMGNRNVDESQNQLGSFCTNVWCNEEQRHEMAIQSVGEHVTGSEN